MVSFKFWSPLAPPWRTWS